MKQYFLKVYGQLPPNIHGLELLYLDLLPVQTCSGEKKKCSASECKSFWYGQSEISIQAFAQNRTMIKYNDNVVALQKPLKYRKPIPNHKWIEIIRTKDPKIPGYGCWAYPVTGSGVYVYTGRVFHMGNKLKPNHNIEWNKTMGFFGDVAITKHAWSHKYDSLDFISAHGFPFGTPLGQTPEPVSHEFVKYCFDSNNVCIPDLRTGWNASRTCSCDDTKSLINCAHKFEFNFRLSKK
jgi:hypothetical protein